MQDAMTAPLCEMLRNSAEFWKGGIRELAGQGTIAHQVSLSQAAPGSTQAALRAQARALRFRQTPTCPLISYRWPSMLILGGAKTGSKLVDNLPVPGIGGRRILPILYVMALRPKLGSFL